MPAAVYRARAKPVPRVASYDDLAVGMERHVPARGELISLDKLEVYVTPDWACHDHAQRELERMRAGDDGAFEEYVRAYSTRLLAVVRDCMP